MANSAFGSCEHASTHTTHAKRHATVSSCEPEHCNGFSFRREHRHGCSYRHWSGVDPENHTAWNTHAPHTAHGR